MEFEYVFPVEWFETDALGIVHFSNYFKYFEKAESEFLRKIGLSYEYMISQGIAIPRVEAFCKYLRPLRYGDTVKVSLKVSEIGNKHLKYTFSIFAENKKEKVAEGYVIIVTIDIKTFKAISIPHFIIEKLQKFKL